MRRHLPDSPSFDNPVSGSNFFTGVIYLLMFAYALSMTMIGPMMPSLISQYRLHLSQGGLVMTFQSIGGLLAVLTGVLLIDRCRKPKLILILFAAYGLSLLSLSLTPGYGFLLGMFFILGAATRMLDSTLNAYIADMYPERRGLYLNLLHTSFGIGALIGPIYAHLLMSRGIPWKQTFGILSLVCLAIWLLYYWIYLKHPNLSGVHQATASQGYLNLLKNPGVLLLCLILLMYTGHQSGIMVWLPMYLEKGLKTDSFWASCALSLFWGGIVLGRVITSLIVARIKPAKLLLGGGLLGGCILTYGIIHHTATSMIVTTALAGLATGATIPLVVSIACNWHPQNTGTVSSLLILNNALAGMIFPWFIGWIAQETRFEWGMILTGVTLLVMFVFAIPLVIKERNSLRG